MHGNTSIFLGATHSYEISKGGGTALEYCGDCKPGEANMSERGRLVLCSALVEKYKGEGG
jgi:hypothetical protein